MKVFFLIRALTYGGAEQQLTVLSKALRARGHDVVIAVFYAGGSFEKDLEDTNVKILTLNKGGRWDIFGFLLRLIVAVRQESPDVIQGELPDSNFFVIVLKLFFRNIKVIWGIRGLTRDVRKQTSLERLSISINGWLSRFPDAVITNSQAGRDDCVSQGYPSEKILVIPNGVDIEHFHPDPEARERIRREWGVSERDHVVGIVGRLHPIKDHPNFLTAAGLLSKERKDVRFVCVGDGPAEYRRTLQLLAVELALSESLIWYNACADVPAVYNGLDILVSSSASEGLSNVIAEAMACGVPCVVTDVGDSAWVVGHTGEVVPSKDSVALKNAIQRLLEKKAYGPAQIRQRIVDRLSLNNFIANTERMLNALVSHSMNDPGVTTFPRL